MEDELFQEQVVHREAVEKLPSGFGGRHVMLKHDIDPNDFDDGVQDAVVLLWKGGFRTFTSCEGGRGHSFQHETIGLEIEGTYAVFHRRLVRFLRSEGRENFSVSLVTDYNPNHPDRHLGLETGLADGEGQVHSGSRLTWRSLCDGYTCCGGWAWEYWHSSFSP